MKKFLYILLFIPFLSFGATYYCATDGNDGNDGSIGSPWLDPQYAFDQLRAGDTLFLREGSYFVTEGSDIFDGLDDFGIVYIQDFSGGPAGIHDGTEANPIVVTNYPGEEVIFDGSTIVATWASTTCLKFFQLNWWVIDSLYFINTPYNVGGTVDDAMLFINCQNIIVQHCKAYWNEGGGIHFRMSGDSVLSTENTIQYCDAFENYDWWESPPGNSADGIRMTYTDTGAVNYMRHNRSWYNSDDGYDMILNNGKVYLDSNWAFLNGFHPDSGQVGVNGEGFKLGDMGSRTGGTDSDNWYESIDSVYRIVRGNLACYNWSDGFTGNGIQRKVELYNNSSFGNIEKGFNWDGCPNVASIFKNNYSDLNEDLSSTAVKDYHGYDNMVETNNSWNISPNYKYEPGGIDSVVLYRTDVISSNQFVSLDSAGLAGVRQVGGALPDIDFLKLAQSSVYIDAGTDVGIPYNDDAPDIGAWEFYIPGLPPVVGYQLIAPDGTMVVAPDGTIIISN